MFGVQDHWVVSVGACGDRGRGGLGQRLRRKAAANARTVAAEFVQINFFLQILIHALEEPALIFEIIRPGSVVLIYYGVGKFLGNLNF